MMAKRGASEPSDPGSRHPRNDGLRSMLFTSLTGLSMCNSSNGSLANRVTRAYVSLFLEPELEDGSRSILLGRFGNYEVRIVELSPKDIDSDQPVWIELYARDIDSSLDSCLCGDLDQAITAAEGLFSEAQQLDEKTSSSS
jgi:hypothetical protein